MAKYNMIFDQLDLVTYEEVLRLETYHRKTLVLLGKFTIEQRTKLLFHVVSITGVIKWGHILIDRLVFLSCIDNPAFPAFMIHM